ncbi:hypothetical protein AMTR_s00109p00139170 [Amborella trichopoda]|uniref:Uncharacterized protein n=1 Tax=Amborella trichopoda TaxID=13333 RepID=W1NVL3_AMBTC|nr:hypothetical protein AMTR_s00109p00139170 [Amborella trichopoda]
MGLGDPSRKGIDTNLLQETKLAAPEVSIARGGNGPNGLAQPSSKKLRPGPQNVANTTGPARPFSFPYFFIFFAMFWFNSIGP